VNAHQFGGIRAVDGSLCKGANPDLGSRIREVEKVIQKWLAEIKEHADPEGLGMILVHNGIVRGTSKQGAPVARMHLSYDEEKLALLVDEQKRKPGITDVKAWINRGDLKVGDNIMFLLVAGRFRTDVLPVFETTLSIIKKEIVDEREAG
jgi:molybdopterin synthase catalytic subunit